MFFAAGIGTVLQTAIGSRLPILEGASFTFVTPAIALLTSSNYECLHPAQDESEEDIWQSRMQILQGGLIIASVVQVQGYSSPWAIFIDYGLKLSETKIHKFKFSKFMEMIF